MKVLLEFKDSHHYIIEYQHTSDIFCPGCGNKWVWVCQEGGDYYVGESHICTKCGLYFYLPNLDKNPSEEYKLVIKQLRDGLVISPTTPRGH